jgi:putative DNA primase/helicase
VLIPIPSGSKGRGLKRGWNLEENAIRTEEQAARLNGCNLGLAHRWCGTCAVDVDDDRLAGPWLIKEHGIDLQALLAAPDAVQITSGRPNRAKLVYRLPADVEWLPTFNLKEIHSIGLELRCATRGGAKTVQDILPPSLHPDTKRLYKWAGSGDWHRISVLPDALLRAWSELAKSNRSSRRARAAPKPRSRTQRLFGRVVVTTT